MDEEELALIAMLAAASASYDAKAIANQAELDAIILNLEAEGVDVEALIESRESNLINASVAAFLTAMALQAVGSVRQIAQSGVETYQRQNYGEDQLYAWQTNPTPSGKHCPDCLERESMEPRTMAEWEATGLPRQGSTICNDKCMCVLTRVSAS